MKIGVFGSSSTTIPDQVREKARQLGAEIARTGHTLVTGAGPGVPRAAVLGAWEAGGRTIGFSPAPNLETHVKAFNSPADGYSELVFLPEGFKYRDDRAISAKYRSILAVANSDAVIIIGGRTGTMLEFLVAYDAGKVIGILEGTGGITDRAIDTILEDIEKETGARIIRESDPVALVRKIVEIDEEEKHITF